MKKISIMILLLVVAFASCKKTPEVNLEYVDVERDLITVGTTTATVQCDYEYIATLKKAFFYYGESETDMNVAEMRVVQNTLYVDLAGLKESATYNYYYEFHNGFNSMRTALKTFKTEAGNGGGEEPPTPPEIMLPTVITSSVTEITSNSAKGGGEVTNDGGGEVTERGICWSTNANPTLNDNHIAIGTGIGEFVATVSGLDENTTYHIRAYAINEKGAAYGLDREFTTLVYVPEGAINGLFTVDSLGRQVYFSQGNLQYQASTNTWRFAENQWDYVGDQTQGTVYENGMKCDNSLISSTYNGWIDLFGWGTSGYHNSSDPYNVNYQPWSTTDSYVSNDNYFGYGPSINTTDPNLTGTSANYDWGVYNPISNGGNQTNQWRTLTGSEWDYVLFTRSASTVNGVADARYAKANVDNVRGVILLPDSYTHPTGVAQPVGINETNGIAGWYGNNYSVLDFTLMQNAGAVFLPAAGMSCRTFVCQVGFDGCYWSASCHPYDSSNSLMAFFNEDGFFSVTHTNSLRNYCQSVRLVQDANK